MITIAHTGALPDGIASGNVLPHDQSDNVPASAPSPWAARPDVTKAISLYETHLPVADLVRSVRFYRDVVGLTHAWSDAGRGLAFMYTGGKADGMLGLWQAEKRDKSPLRYEGFPLWHFAFAVPLSDVIQSLANLTSKGVQPLGFAGEPITEPVVIGWMPCVSVYFKDPDGHSVEYIAILSEDGDESFGIGTYSAWKAKSAAMMAPD